MSADGKFKSADGKSMSADGKFMSADGKFMSADAYLSISEKMQKKAGAINSSTCFIFKQLEVSKSEVINFFIQFAIRT